MQKTNQVIWRMLGERLREVMPVNAAATVDMQILVLRLAVRETGSVQGSGRRASAG